MQLAVGTEKLSWHGMPLAIVVGDLRPCPTCLPGFHATNNGSPAIVYKTWVIARHMNTRLSKGHSACGAKGSNPFRSWVSVCYSWVSPIWCKGKALQMPIIAVGARISTLKWAASQLNTSLETFAHSQCVPGLCAANHVGTFNELNILRNMNTSLSAGCREKGRDQLRPCVSFVFFLVSIASCHGRIKSGLCNVAPFGIG